MILIIIIKKKTHTQNIKNKYALIMIFQYNILLCKYGEWES